MQYAFMRLKILYKNNALKPILDSQCAYAFMRGFVMHFSFGNLLNISGKVKFWVGTLRKCNYALCLHLSFGKLLGISWKIKFWVGTMRICIYARLCHAFFILDISWENQILGRRREINHYHKDFTTPGIVLSIQG